MVNTDVSFSWFPSAYSCGLAYIRDIHNVFTDLKPINCWWNFYLWFDLRAVHNTCRCQVHAYSLVTDTFFVFLLKKFFLKKLQNLYWLKVQ